MVQTGSIGIDVKMKRLSVVPRQEENMMLMQMMRGRGVLKDRLGIERMLPKLVIFMIMPNLAHGAPLRPHGAEDTEEAVKVNNSIEKGSESSIIGESGSARANIANTNVKQQTLGGNGEEN